jgi:hypothetical protein
MEYRNLSKYEKLAQIQKLHFCRAERHNVAVYLKALWRNDTQTLNEYESLGDYPYKFLMNKRAYDNGLLFGFVEKKFDKYGWLCHPEFIEKEHFEFTHKQGWDALNFITIGKGLNGKWTYGVSYSTGGAGGSCGMDIWGMIFDNRKECLASALQKLMDCHRRNKEIENNSKCKTHYSTIIYNQAKDLYDTLMGRKVIQLSLF